MEKYLANARIQHWEVTAIINAKEKCSIVTTGLLELINLKGYHVQFQREFIALSNTNIESLGKIRNLSLFLKEDIPLKHTFLIVKGNDPCLILGQDWFKRYQAKIKKSGKELRFHLQGQRNYVPIEYVPSEIIEEEEEDLIEDLILLSSDESTELSEEEMLSGSEVAEEFLIDLSESSVTPVSQKKYLIHPDLVGLSMGEFQETPSRENLKYDVINSDESCDLICDIILDYMDENQKYLSTQLLEKSQKKQLSKTTSKTEKQRNVQRVSLATAKKKCFLCDYQNHVMKECSLLSKFRKHELICKEMGIHVWKSWNKFKAKHLQSIN